MSDDKFREHYEYVDEELIDASSGGTTDAYNNLISDEVKEVSWDPYIPKDKGHANILGLPLYYNPLCDPSGRVYNETFISDLPLIYMIPGKPVLNKKLVTESGSELSGQMIANTLDQGKELLSFGVRNVKNFRDIRFLSFRRDYKTYFNYVEVMLSIVYNLMGLDGIFSYKDVYETTFSHIGLCFYADKATSISESANNQYGQSTIAEQANANAAITREYSQFLGIGDESIVGAIQNGLSAIMDQLSKLDVIGNIVTMFSKRVDGSQLYYPDIWTDSNFDRSYNIQFKFHSPYGDKLSIFRNVYVPFISLLALALPKQDGLYGYKEPFLVRLSSPGWFETECGAITSISFKKGGDDSVWTVDGLPNEIEVTLTIVDLYPTMMASNSFRRIGYNAGLTSFLECMAGIRFDQLSLALRAEAMVKNKLTAVGNILSLQSVKNGFYDWIGERRDSLIDKLR